MPHLFTPYALSNLTLPNRLVIPPMCQYSAQEGNATDWHVIHYGNLSHSGAGLLIVEATAVEPVGRISPFDIGLWSEANEAALRPVVASVRRHSSMPLAIQLGHAGRKGSCAAPWDGGKQVFEDDGGWQTVAPSAIPYKPEERAPQALDTAGLVRIRAAFVSAAQRAERLGFDAIEVHAAHGYLLHQFLSPMTNQRTDEYGGALENRLRFPLEVFEAVRAAVPQRVVGIRISATDWVEGGWELEQSVVLAQALKARGCDFIHVSSGGLAPQQRIPVRPGYQVPFGECIRRETGLPTITVGMIDQPEQAEAIVAEGCADLVAIGRPMLYDPRWPWRAAAKLGAQVDAPPQYWRGTAPAGLFSKVKPGSRFEG